MDLEDFTIDISYPIEALEFVNKMFVNELFDTYWDMSKDDTKSLFNFLHVYSYIVELLTKDMKGINDKYKLKVEEFFDSQGKCMQ